GEKPLMRDWIDHMSTIFPEVRLKQFLEMRGTDGGPWSRLCALPAFWVGLLYDSEAVDAAWNLVKEWTFEEIQAMRDEVPRLALKTPFRNRTLQDIALEALEISHKGLGNRRCLDSIGLDETHFLKPLFQTAHSGITPAEEMLNAYEGRWGGSVDPVFQEYTY
ncbi:MAG: glutamate-cysteine ligase family protein, partial [Rhodospirillales bacterium]